MGMRRNPLSTTLTTQRSLRLTHTRRVSQISSLLMRCQNTRRRCARTKSSTAAVSSALSATTRMASKSWDRGLIYHQVTKPNYARISTTLAAVPTVQDVSSFTKREKLLSLRPSLFRPTHNCSNQV
jgi:regulator of sirC expression with transglutaminase-like and TPR domain